MNLDIITTNCRSLLPKLDELKILCHLYNPNYVFLSETWLNIGKPNKLLNIEHYNLLRSDRKYRRGSGVCAYIRNTINFEEHKLMGRMQTLMCLCLLQTNVFTSFVIYRQTSPMIKQGVSLPS